MVSKVQVSSRLSKFVLTVEFILSKASLSLDLLNLDMAPSNSFLISSFARFITSSVRIISLAGNISTLSTLSILL